jgi:hypothetical protein
MSTVRCACGNWLGVCHPDGRFEMRHRGRRWIGQVPDSITCEKCQAEWKPDMKEDRELLPALLVLT